MLGILRMLSKTWDQFTAIPDLQNSEECGDRKLSQKFSEKICSP